MEVAKLSGSLTLDTRQFNVGMQAALAQMQDFNAHAARMSKQAVRNFEAVASSVFSLKGALMGLGLGMVAKGFLDTASSVEKMKISLDTMTKGKGIQTFEALNNWAKQMPVNTEKAIQAFTQLKAMGLEPTLKDMTTLVDTASALGGEADTLEGIARALGQIKTKGKVSAEELMQLAERGVPAYQILQEKLGLSAKEMDNLAKAGVSAEQAISALLEGMQERFGGQSVKMMSSWSGLWEALKAQVFEFERLMMESGPFQIMKQSLAGFVDYFNTAQGQMDLARWAHEMSVGTLKAFDAMLAGAQWFNASIKPIMAQMWEHIQRLWDTYRQLPDWVQTTGLLGALVGGKKGMVMLAAGVHLLDAFQNSYRGLLAVMDGEMDASDFIFSNREELEANLKALDKTKDDLTQIDKLFRQSGTDADSAIGRIRARIQEMINTPFEFKPTATELPQIDIKPKVTLSEATGELDKEVLAQKKRLEAMLAQAQLDQRLVGIQNPFDAQRLTILSQTEQMLRTMDASMQPLIESWKELSLATVEANENFQRSMEEMQRKAALVREITQTMQQPLAEFFAEFAETGQLTWEKLAHGLMKSLRMMAAQKTAEFLMQAAYHAIMTVVDPYAYSNAGISHATSAMMALKGATMMGAYVAGSGLSGMAHDGMDSIPREGTWLLDRGERVVDARTNKDLKSFLQSDRGGTTVNQTVTIQAKDDEAVLQAVKGLPKLIEETVCGDIHRNGRIRQTIKAIR